MPEQYYLVADLALLACPENIESYDPTFKKAFKEVLLTHNLALAKLNKVIGLLSDKGIDVRCQWAFSGQFLYMLYTVFFNRIKEQPWLSDIIVSFTGFLKAQSPLDCPDDIPIAGPIQNWLPIGIHDDLYKSWLQLIACCANGHPGIPVIVSSDRVPGPTAQFNIQGNYFNFDILHIPENWIQDLPAEHQDVHRACNGKLELFFQQVNLFVIFTDWNQLNIRINPWARANLPLGGDFPYVPPRTWQPGQLFQREDNCQHQPCYKDHHGRNWEWDRMENHWDVQENPPRHNRYDRVTPDGRQL